MVFVPGSAFPKSELLAYACAVGLAFAVMAAPHQYAPLGIVDAALQVRNPHLRYFLFRSSVTRRRRFQRHAAPKAGAVMLLT